MIDVEPARNTQAADWLLRSGADWWDLVRYGPPGFDTYARIAFEPDLALRGGEMEDDSASLEVALCVLAGHTATSTVAYAAIWEGWTSRHPVPDALRVHIPEREMLLFTGPVDLMRQAPGRAWGDPDSRQEPHLVWPEDRAWCVACEVDEEIEFTVGCSRETALALAEAMLGAVRHVAYGAPAPMYRGSD